MADHTLDDGDEIRRPNCHAMADVAGGVHRNSASGGGIHALSSNPPIHMPDEADPDERIEDDLNRCTVCGGVVANGVRMVHEDGGPLCLACARIVMPKQVENAERMWRELTGDEPKVSDE